MNIFNSTKTHEINVWTPINKSIKTKYETKCPHNVKLFMQHYIYEIERLENGLSTTGKFMVERIICGTKILDEKHTIKY